jgi:hypothetical protein
MIGHDISCPYERKAHSPFGRLRASKSDCATKTEEIKECDLG